MLAGCGGRIDSVTLDGDTYYRTQWRASTFPVSSQGEVALAVGGAGEIVCVWSSRRQQSGRYGVYGQRFRPDGTALGTETCLNLWTTSHERTPAVALDRAGAWVVWQSHGQDGHGGSIVARRFDRDLAGGDEILVNTRWEGDQTDPVVAVDAGGSALVAWTSAAPGGRPEVRARLLGPDGKPRGDEMTLARGARSPAATAAWDGGFAIAYGVSDAAGRPAAIMLVMIGAEGRPGGDAIDVSGPLARQPVEPAIAATADGLVVAWHEADDDSGDYVTCVRRVTRPGGPAGGTMIVGTAVGGPQSGAAVAAAPEGGFAVAFNGHDGNGPCVFARLYAADGSPRGGCFRLTGHASGSQSMRNGSGTARLHFSPAGDLVCGWSGDGGFADRSAAGVTVLSPRPPAPVTPGIDASMPPAVTLVAATGGPQPHQPPTFDRRRVESAQRQIVHGLVDTGFTGIISTGWTPPDPHMAVGPNHVVLMTNGAIAFLTKAGVLTFQDQIEGAGGFWGSVGATGFVFDPEVIYDELTGRFFAMAAEGYAPGDRSYALVAVSDDSNPDGTWHRYRFETTAIAGEVFDSPNISVDADTVYITGDAFGLASAYAVFAYDKVSLLAGLPPAMSNSMTVPTSTLSAGIPPVSFDDPPALYMIEHKENLNNTAVRLIALQDALGTPSITTVNLTVPGYGRPEDPPQMGTTVRPETFDARFWSVAYRNGSLWATHHINSDRVLARWYEVAMNGWPDSGVPVLVQSGEIDPGPGEIDPGPGVRTFFSSISVDVYGNAAMSFARSSPSEFISMGTAFRYASDPPGSFGTPVLRKSSTGPYTSSRWGDYSAVNVDPSDGFTFWAHHEYAESSSWRTWVTGFTPSFDPADIDRDGVVGVSDLLILLGAWGPCPAPPAPCPADIDGDGSIGVTDLLALLAAWDG